MKSNDATPIMHKFAREISLEEIAMVAGGDTVGTSGPKGYIETLDESGDGPDTVNGKPGTGAYSAYTETYG